MIDYGYDAPCMSLSGLGAPPLTAQRRAALLERQKAATARRQAAAFKRSERQATAKAKRLAKVAGRTVRTANPEKAEKIQAAITAAQRQMSNVADLANRARRSRSKVDVQKALAAANSAGNFLKTLIAPTPPPIGAQRLRGMGYLGACVDDGTGAGTYIDDQTNVPCGDPSSQIPTDIYPPSGGGAGYPGYPGYPTPGLPTQYPGAPGYPGYGGSTGLVPGFGTGLPAFGSGYAPLRACATGSNLPRCIIYQMAVDEQQQFQFVFTILQQMYAQLLSIVQQLMAQLQQAQQSPYAYGQQPPYDPYGQNPFNPYGGAGAPGGGYGYDPAYGGQYPGPGYPGVPYYPGGADSSIIPPGYGDSSDMSTGVPGEVSQAFPGPTQGPGGGYPSYSYGGPPPGLITSDSLPAGADPTAGDDASGLIPYGGEASPGIAQSQTGPTLSPSPNVQAAVQTTTASTLPTPQIIVLQTGPGQSPYADAGLPAGDKQNQPQLDPPQHDEYSYQDFN